MLTGFMSSRETAERLGIAPSGSARAYNPGDEPLVRMRNTAIVAGTSTLDDMIAGVDDGYLLLRTANGPIREKECTYCNKCLINDLKHPLGCYELSRYDGATFEEKYDRMIETVMSVFEPPAFS